MVDRSTFGKYVLLRKLATGGMGEVFLAKQVGPSGFEKLLVIKRILSQHHDKHEYLNMFLSEARLVAYLTHSNIIQIHEMGQIDGDYFIAMEYVRGRSLRDIIDALRTQGKQLPLAYVIDLAIKLCDGLGYAHEARDIRARPMNIIHRDINPHNVLVSYGGDLKIIDFGIAKSEMTDVHTATGTIKGKFVYMSPEQSAADPIDRKSDIFSLGIVIYEMATGENPFVRQNVVLSLEAIQRHPVAPPSAKRADAVVLDAVLAKALEKKPEDRYQTAYEMRDDLRNLLRVGSIRPSENDLSGFLHELFKAEIDEEDRLLAEADRATSPPRPSMSSPAPDPRLPTNLPSMPAFSSPPSSNPGMAEVDYDTKADRPARTPQPIRAAAFADDEPTLATDPGEMAARSRLQSMVSKAGGIREPTGQVFTLIAPEEVAPGTNEEFINPIAMEPHTKRERVPLTAQTGPNTAELQVDGQVVDRPVAALSEPLDTGLVRQRMTASPPPPPRPSIPLAASASGIEIAESLPGTDDVALSVPPVASGSEPPMALPPRSPPPLGELAPDAGPRFSPRPELSSGRLSGTLTGTNGALRTPPRPVPSAPSIALPPSVSVPDLVREVRDESSASLPVYTGTSRRSTIVAGVLVFAVATIAGFWGVRSLLSLWGEPAVDAPIQASDVAVLASPSPSDYAPVEPARDPTLGAAAIEPRTSPSPSTVMVTAEPTPAAKADDPKGRKPTKAEARAAAKEAAAAKAEAAREEAEARAAAKAEAAAKAKADAAAKAEAKAEAAAKAKADAAAKAEADAAAKAEAKARAAEAKAKASAAPKVSAEPKAIVAEPKASAEPKSTPTPEPKSEPKASAEAKAEPKGDSKAPSRLGIVTLSASTEVTVEHDGKPVGSSPSSLMIRGDSGSITLSGANIPYTVKLTYRVVDGELSVKVDTNPWSIVKHNGISLGKTPQEPGAGKRHKFSLVKPGQAEALDVSLLWNPTSK